MKIYLFNPETGVYLGEDFADKRLVAAKGYHIPSDGTTIKPPQVNRGEILIFNVVEQRWEISAYRCD